MTQTTVDLEKAINELRIAQKALRRLNREFIYARLYEPHTELAADFLQVDFALDLICRWLVNHLMDQPPLLPEEKDPTEDVGS